MTYMSIFRRLIQWTGNLVLLLLFLFLAMTLLAPRYLDMEFLTVASGSMVPDIPVGAIVAVSPVDYTHILPGDVITFVSPEGPSRIVTHRVQEVTVMGSERAFRTKGDANQDTDLALVSPGMVRGRVCAAIPLLGYLAQFVRTKLGWLLMAAVPTGIIVISELIDILSVIWADPTAQRDGSASSREDAASRFRRLTNPYWSTQKANRE
jgi:signal peptidase